ncbi:hypothetical protein GCM10023238_05040 [Streptomyces heliomycini]
MSGARAHAHGIDLRLHFKKACKAAGLVDGRGEARFTPHSLRHFFASTALANGVSLLEVSGGRAHVDQRHGEHVGHIVPEAWDRCRDVIQSALRPLRRFPWLRPPDRQFVERW